MRSTRTKGAIVAGLFSSAALASQAWAQDIDTVRNWNGISEVTLFGDTNTATYGQLITPNETQRNLNGFTFYLRRTAGTPGQMQAFVYEWDPLNARITGPALFASSILAEPTPTSFTPVSVSTGNVILTPGKQYVLFLTTSSIPGQPSVGYAWGRVFGNATYPGGNWAYMNNGDVFSQLSMAAWNQVGIDLAFLADFFSRPAFGLLTINQQAVANVILNVYDTTFILPTGLEGLTPAQLTQLTSEVATAAVSSGLYAADLFLGQLSDPSVTSSGGGDAGEPAAFAPLGFSANPEKLSSPAALTALGAGPSAADAANRALAISAAHGADAADMAIDRRWKLWGSVYGGGQRLDGDPIVGSASFRTQNWGVVSGVDRSFGNARLGMALGGSWSTFSLTGGLGSGDAGVFNAGIYGGFDIGNAYVSAAAAYGFNSVSTTRTVGIDTLSASYNAHTVGARLEAGYHFHLGGVAITSFGAAQAINYSIPAYAETSALGGPAALTFGAQNEAAIRTELGIDIAHTIPTSMGSIRLSGRAAWVYNADPATNISTVLTALSPQSFNVGGAAQGRHALKLDASIEASISDRLTAKLSFQGQFSGGDTSYGAAAKLSYRW